MDGRRLVVFGLVGLLGKVLSSELGFDLEKPPVSTQISDVTAIGLMLFRYFNLPFQIVGVLLLVATVGVVVLSRGSSSDADPWTLPGREWSLFIIGLAGVILRRNIIVIFMCLELMLNAANPRWSRSPLQC